MAMTSTITTQRPLKSLTAAEIKTRVTQFANDIGEHKVFMLAGSIAYTTALSLAPFVLILLAFAALLGQGFQNQIYAQLTSLLGEQAGAMIKIVVENADNRQGLTTVSGIIGLLVLAISASAIFSQLRSALDIINETPEAATEGGVKGFVKDRIFSLGLVFGFVFLAITSLAISTIVASVFTGSDAVVWNLVALLANVFVFTLLFTAMFHFVPTEHFEWKRCLVAGVCATLFFLIGKYAIGLYLGNASVGSAYGAAGTLIVFLVWVYYSAATLLVSYEFTNNMLIAAPDRNTKPVV